MKRRLVLLCSVGILMAAAPPETLVTEALQRSRAATQKLLTTLQGNLKGLLSSAGPVVALEACQTIAPALNSQVSHEQNLTIRRVSLKTRNPKNAPDESDRKALKYFEELRQTGLLKPETEWHEVKGQSLYYLKPIVIAEACLQCHGPVAKISTEVQAALKKRYPNDQATGYQLGDLRGAVSVRVPLKPIQP